MTTGHWHTHMGTLIHRAQAQLDSAKAHALEAAYLLSSSELLDEIEELHNATEKLRGIIARLDEAEFRANKT